MTSLRTRSRSSARCPRRTNLRSCSCATRNSASSARLIQTPARPSRSAPTISIPRRTNLRCLPRTSGLPFASGSRTKAGWHTTYTRRTSGASRSATTCSPLAVSQETYQCVRNILRTGRKAGLLPTRITLENGGATQYLEPDRIICIQASGKRSIVRTAEGSLELEGLLRDIEPQLPGVFVRVHRSYLVNAAHVLRLRRFALELSNGSEVPVPERALHCRPTRTVFTTRGHPAR